VSRGESAARWVVVGTASAVLLAVAGLAVAIVDLSACGGDGGAAHAAGGSPQRDYCDASLQLLALLAPVPLIVGALASGTRHHGRRLAALCVLGLAIASTPVLAAFILPG